VKVAGQEWNMQMPGLGESALMTDARMAGTLTYVRRAWNNYGSPIDPGQVADVRLSAAGRSSPWTAEELLDPGRVVQAVVGDALEPYRPLLDGGDAEKGRILFHSNREIRCNACHKVGSSGGGFVGPDLTAVGSRADREHLLESLIEPSRKIAQGYETIVVETDDGRVVSGTFVAERDGQLVLAPPAGGEVSVRLDSIVERTASSISSMPPMGQTFTPSQIADLVAYLHSLSGPGEQP
jgi:putative heme-binding domain-containing protein